MGTWGIGIFENDDSMDFASEVETRSDVKLINEALDKVVKEKIVINAEVASRALAAACLVKTGITGDISLIPFELPGWMSKTALSEWQKLRNKSIIAIQRVKNESELRDLFSTTEYFQDWLKLIEDLEKNWP